MKLWRILWLESTGITAFFQGCGAVGWGVLLLGPFNVFASSQYVSLRQIAPPVVWGVWMLALGIAWLVSLEREWRLPTALCFFAAAPTWGAFAFTFLLSGTVLTGFVIYGLMALFSSIISVRLAWKGA